MLEWLEIAVIAILGFIVSVALSVGIDEYLERRADRKEEAEHGR